MSSLDDWLLIIQALIDSNKASTDANKKYYDDKMKKLREIIASIFDKPMKNIDHIFPQHQISSKDNDVEEYGL